MHRMKQDARRAGFVTIYILISLLVGLQPAWAKKAPTQQTEPDYTKGEQLVGYTGSHWALGSTGVIGSFWTKGGNNTSDTRMVLIKEVEEGSPADGVLKKGDVILGVGKDRFTSDPRRVLANAVTEAEKKKNGGKLTLNIWSPAPNGGSGKTGSVTLTLPVMGTFSETAPWECPKTTAIIDKAAQSIVRRKLGRGGITDFLAALGLLATGEEKYVPIVREFAHRVGDPNKTYKIGPDGTTGPGTWYAAYHNLFLTEYHLATGDEYVLPHIRNLSTYIALGRSGVGTWSHGMADVKKNGYFGPPCAYGAMNQCSITCGLSLVLAQKCGIKKPVIDEAVVKAIEFLLWFVDKGTVPYGDHNPALNHDNNGRNSQAAVLFDIYGDKEAAEYFTRMTLASYPVREGGHTGHFFSWQWGALGAARGGEDAAASFVKNTRYFTELERRFDGRSVYQHQLGGEGNGKYRNWDTTGSRLLQHCLPRRKLYITGKGGSTIAPITGDDLKTVVAAADFDPQKLSTAELLEALGSWSRVVRHNAAEELGKRDENVVQELIAMLDSRNRYARYGACIGLQFAGRKSEAAVKALIDKLENEKSMTMRFYAILGLQKASGAKNGLGEVVKTATPALLKLVAEYDAKRDPYGKLQQQIAGTLLYSGRTRGYKGYLPGGEGIEKQDPDLVVSAMKAWLKNPNGGARSLAAGVYDNLSQEQIDKLWPEVYFAAKNSAPSGVMFAGKGKADSTVLLAKNRFKEGLPLAVDYLTEDGWGKFGRVPAAFDALSNYGSAMKEYMPVMQEEYDDYVSHRKSGEVKNCKEKWAKVQENLNKTFELRSIDKYLKK